jgi:hypothetical protein
MLQMARLKIEARADWRQDGKPATRNTFVRAIAPGESTTDWQTEKTRSVNDLKTLFKTANQKKRVTLLLEPNYARMIFPDKRDIDFLSIAFFEWSSKSGSLMTATCKDLTVLKSSAVTTKIADAEKSQAVTLQLNGDTGFAV